MTANRAAALLLSVLLVAPLAACGSDEPDSSSSAGSDAGASATPTAEALLAELEATEMAERESTGGGGIMSGR